MKDVALIICALWLVAALVHYANIFITYATYNLKLSWQGYIIPIGVTALELAFAWFFLYLSKVL